MRTQSLFLLAQLLLPLEVALGFVGVAPSVVTMKSHQRLPLSSSGATMPAVVALLRLHLSPPASNNNNNSEVEAARLLLERARKMREEIAELTGQTVEQVEQEAAAKKQKIANVAAKAAADRQERKNSKSASSRSSTSSSGGADAGRFLPVPETPDDQIWQAKAAVERAFAAGLTRQVVRFALVPENETLNQQDRQWPGGAQQMYREAAGPLTRELLQQLRAPTAKKDDDSDDDTTAPTATQDNSALTKQPTVRSQDIWDFDGSALITAEHANASGDVQAMVQPNTDNKYTNDIGTIDRATGDRLFLLINPFWRDLDSWGFNILAPGAKEKAAAAIFNRGFAETYCVLQKSVRGEDCVALKAYPYDWQLYAYAESDYWPFEQYSVHLGSTVHEPKSSDFSELLSQREEFKLSKNMRQVQRMMNKGD